MDAQHLELVELSIPAVPDTVAVSCSLYVPLILFSDETIVRRVDVLARVVGRRARIRGADDQVIARIVAGVVGIVAGVVDALDSGRLALSTSEEFVVKITLQV